MSGSINFRINIEHLRQQRIKQRINESVQKNISLLQKKIDDIDKMSNTTYVDYEKKQIEQIILSYIEEIKDNNDKKQTEIYENLIKELNTCSTYNEVVNIQERAASIYYEYKEVKKTDQEVITEYMISKLQEIGQEVSIDEDGNLISNANGENLLVSIESDNINIDVNNTGRKCANTVLKLEKSTKNELEKIGFKWHDAEDEKKIRRRMSAKKQKVKNHEIYDTKLLSREK